MRWKGSVRAGRGQARAQRRLVDEQLEQLLAVERDDRDALEIRALQSVVARDVELDQLERMLVADALKRAGFEVDSVSMDWGTLLQRRQKKDPPEAGGWSAYVVLNSGGDVLTPIVNATLRGPKPIEAARR